jgi:hypothetical protein
MGHQRRPLLRPSQTLGLSEAIKACYIALFSLCNDCTLGLSIC